MIIMCYTVEEAQQVYQLQPLIETMDMSQSAEDLARSIASSADIRDILSGVRFFYPVAYGIRETGIHRDWCVISDMTHHYL
jgi:hypothetical protein